MRPASAPAGFSAVEVPDMHTWHHRMTGVEILHDVKHVGAALVSVPREYAREPQRKLNGSVEYRIPGSALASFGWDAGVMEAASVIRQLLRPHAEQNVGYNDALQDVLVELDRLRKIGR